MNSSSIDDRRDKAEKGKFWVPYLTLFSLVTAGILVIALILVLILFFSGVYLELPKPDKVVAQLNDWPISLEELKRSISEEGRRDKGLRLTRTQLLEYLDMLIAKEVLIQEATRRKLAQREDFIRTVEKFWEQTLIRDLLDLKSQEILQTSFVSEEELKGYYSLKGVQVVIRRLSFPDYSAALKVRAALMQGKEPAWEVELGPLTLDRFELPMARELVGLRPGEVKIIPTGSQVLPGKSY